MLRSRQGKPMTSFVTDLKQVVYDLATSPSGVCFAASESGLYRSDDTGKTWHFAYESLTFETSPMTYSVALSPQFDTDQTVFAGIPGAVLRSSDGGQSWHGAGLGSPPPSVICLMVSPNYLEDGMIFAGTMEDGVFCSTDRGVHWFGWNFGLLDLNINCVAISPHFATDETLLVGTETGLFHSTNGGRAWREVALPDDELSVLSLVLTSGLLLLGTDEGLYRSDNQGRSWVRLTQDEAVNAIEVSNDDHILLAGETQVYDLVGDSWNERSISVQAGITTMAAPNGLEKPALVASAGGGLLWV